MITRPLPPTLHLRCATKRSILNSSDIILKSTFTTIGTSGPVTNVNGQLFNGGYHIHRVAGKLKLVLQEVNRAIRLMNAPLESSHSLPTNPPPSQPLPPEIFYGRDELILRLAKIIASNPQPRIAILGAGGMGKTSTALYLLHHDLASARYGHRRYLVTCDAVTSAESLALRILQILKATPNKRENPLTSLHCALKSSPPTLLLLDNFESLWDADGADLNRSGIRDLLQKIAGIPAAALIVTMRASVPPPGIIWTFSETLPPLSLSFARDVFLAINPTSLSDGAASGGKVLNSLLQELDCVPLAITLLAQVSLGLPLAFVLRQWRDKKTSMLRVVGSTLDRLESVDASISMSIAALDVTRNPEAIQLLGMICLLPDGLFRWQDKLDFIEKRYSTAISEVHLLRKFALIYIADDKLDVLSPIRHFVLNYYPSNTEHTQCMYDMFWDIIDTHASVDFGRDFNSAVEVLRPEMGNIASLIDRAAHFNPSPKVLDISIILSWHLRRTYPSTDLLHKVAHLVPTSQPQQKAQYWRIMGEILRVQSKHTQATVILTQARSQLLDLGDHGGAAWCLCRLGEILRDQLLNIGDRHGATEQSLRNILRTENQCTEATVAFTQTRDQLLQLGDHCGAAQCLHTLGDMFRVQRKYGEATAALTEARDKLLDFGDRRVAARCLQTLGDTFRMQEKYTEATVALTKARDELLDVGDHTSAAWCSWSLGESNHMLGKDAAATTMVAEAQEHFLAARERYGEARCRFSMGEIHLMNNSHAEAQILYTQARNIFLEIDHSHDAGQCSERIALCAH